jgi:UDP-N-acetylmuramoyl-L-alanyl-D-glutamate--2,6-diaminopimelate ligase
MLLSLLARSASLSLAGDDVAVTGIAFDSRRVEAGELFVALPGTRTDGMTFVDEARSRGAVALCAVQAVPGLPTLVTDDPRAALGRLSAAWYGDPARELALVGITGTLGKTSTAQLVLAALGASGTPAAVIGSLGIQVRGSRDDAGLATRLPATDGMTTPDAPTLHRAFRMLVDAGVHTVAMEVTSHALAQRRVEGLVLRAGLMTNLVPDEHLEFHGTAEHYLETKAKFFDLLADDAPIVANADDPLVREMVEAVVARRPHPVVWMTTEGREDATVCACDHVWDAASSRFTLEIRRPLPRLDGGEVAPAQTPLTLPVFGVQHVENAALAATIALIAGASPERLADAVASVAQVKRRMQVLRNNGPTVVDDTSGNPETLRAVFASVRSLPHRALRIVFGIRGMRGPEINRRLAKSLSALLARHEAWAPVSLVVTASEDTADERNRVTPEEQSAFLAGLGDLPHRFEPTLAGAVARLLDGVLPDDAVLVLGAQGMDQAGEMVLRWLDGTHR